MKNDWNVYCRVSHNIFLPRWMGIFELSLFDWLPDLEACLTMKNITQQTYFQSYYDSQYNKRIFTQNMPLLLWLIIYESHEYRPILDKYIFPAKCSGLLWYFSRIIDFKKRKMSNSNEFRAFMFMACMILGLRLFLRFPTSNYRDKVDE